jgi:DNA polymerase I-like protein with 3'-5' exonuclease and polymerase domains
MSLFLDTPDWTRPTTFPKLKGLVGLDFETEDPYLKTHGPSWAFAGIGKVIGIGISTDDGEYYYPVGHDIGNMDDIPKIWAWLKDELETNPDPSLEMIVMNWTYEMGWFRRNGINPTCPVRDPGIAMALVDECRISYSLNAISQTVLGDGKYSDDLKSYAEMFGLKDYMSQLKKLPPMYVGPYCEQDAKLAKDNWIELLKQIERLGLSRVLKLEHEVMPAVLDMRWNGILVDVPKAKETVDKLKKQEQKLIKEIKRQSGCEVEIWAQDSIADAMTLLGIEYPVSKSGKPSFQAEWLENHEHEVPRMIVKARQLNKVQGTFIQSYFLDNQFNGRIHCTFTPLRSDEGGAVTGRFSSSNPNFQNLPARKGEYAAMVRGLVLPEEGCQWAALDYSSQEPRLTVHFAALAGCPGADIAVKEYLDNPRTDYHQFVADLTGLKRKDAKEVNLGLPYGMGGAKLCREKLKLPTRFAIFGKWGSTPQYFDDWNDASAYQDKHQTRSPIEVAGEEGQKILDAYHERLPYMKSLMKMVTDQAVKKGFIKTLLGRHRHFIGKDEKVTKYNRKKAFSYKALNSLIQGSAADQTKQAMIDLHREGVLMHVTVHDELGISVENKKQADDAAEIMMQAAPLKVPTIVDVEIGKTWAASMGLESK